MKIKNYESLQRQQPAYLQLVATLQDVRVLASTATGNYRIAEPAVPATPPYTPRLVVTPLALIVGLVGGVAVAFLAEQLDVRAHGRGPERPSRAAGAPTLAATDEG
jgi:uncharacterized protein involved in exopolysaccharide biosynthesis